MNSVMVILCVGSVLRRVPISCLAANVIIYIIKRKKAWLLQLLFKVRTYFACSTAQATRAALNTRHNLRTFFLPKMCCVYHCKMWVTATPLTTSLQNKSPFCYLEHVQLPHLLCNSPPGRRSHRSRD